MITNRQKINILINKYNNYVSVILNASLDDINKLISLNDHEALNYLQRIEKDKEKNDNIILCLKKYKEEKYYFDI